MSPSAAVGEVRFIKESLLMGPATLDMPSRRVISSTMALDVLFLSPSWC